MSFRNVQPDRQELFRRLHVHPFRSEKEETAALLVLLRKADARQRLDEEKRERTKERYRRQGGSPFERLPFELLLQIVQRLLDANWASNGAYRGKRHNALARRRDAMPVLWKLCLVSKALLPVIRPMLFEAFRMPLKERELDPYFMAQTLPSFASSIKRLTGGLSCAPVIEQAANINTLFLHSMQWERNDEAVARLLKALQKPRPALQTLSIAHGKGTVDAIVKPDDAADTHLALSPHLFQNLQNLTFLAIKLPLTWQLWESLLDDISVLPCLRTLSLQPQMLSHGYLPIKTDRPLHALTMLRMLHTDHAEAMLPGLLARAPNVVKVHLQDCRRWKGSQVCAAQLARQEQREEEYKAANAEAAGEDEMDEAPADSFLELSRALVELAPQRRAAKSWPQYEDEEIAWGLRGADILTQIRQFELKAFRTLLIIDCHNWRAIASHFLDAQITVLSIRAQKSPVDEFDLDVDKQLAGFIEGLESLKTVRLPLQPDADRPDYGDEYSDEDYDHEDEDYLAERGMQYEEAVCTIEYRLRARGIKLCMDNELVCEARWNFGW